MGKLYCSGEFIAHTLELPWKDNEKSISCIPQGNYKCRIRLARESATRDYVHLLGSKMFLNRKYILIPSWKLPFR